MEGPQQIEDIATFAARAEKWLRSVRLPRAARTRQWGEGEFDVTVFHDLEPDVELAAPRRARRLAPREAGRGLRRHRGAGRVRRRRADARPRSRLHRARGRLRGAERPRAVRGHDPPRRPDDRRLRDARTAGALRPPLPARRRVLLPALLRAGRRERPGRPGAHAPPATATTGCSTARRSGPPTPASRRGVSPSAEPTRTSPSTRAHRVPRAHPQPGPGGPTHQADERRGLLQRGVLRSARPIADDLRIGDVGDGWKVALTVLGFERETSGSSGRRGGDFEDLLGLARAMGRTDEPAVRQDLARVYSRERNLEWTRARTAAEAADARAGRGTGGFGGEAAVDAVDDRRVSGRGPPPRPCAHGGHRRVGHVRLERPRARRPGLPHRRWVDEIQRNIIGERVLGSALGAARRSGHPIQRDQGRSRHSAGADDAHATCRPSATSRMRVETSMSPASRARSECRVQGTVTGAHRMDERGETDERARRERLAGVAGRRRSPAAQWDRRRRCSRTRAPRGCSRTRPGAPRARVVAPGRWWLTSAPASGLASSQRQTAEMTWPRISGSPGSSSARAGDHDVVHRRQHLPKSRLEQLVLAGEVVVDRGRCHTGLGRHGLDAGVGEALPREHPDGGVDDRAAA